MSPSLVMEGQVPEGHKLELPFQVGLRDAREGAITAEEMEVRMATAFIFWSIVDILVVIFLIPIDMIRLTVEVRVCTTRIILSMRT